MTQHFYVTLEVEGNKVVKIEEPKNFRMRPLMAIVPGNLKNQTIAAALTQLEANGLELKDVSEGDESSSNSYIESLLTIKPRKATSRKYYLLQYPAGR